MSDMKCGFEMRTMRLALADILPVRQIKDPQTNIHQYRTIRASIKEVGLIEPLVVYPQRNIVGKYLLLDGHLRVFALRDLGHTEAECLVAKDDEGFTYNARVNRLNPISEHKMIMKAVNNGVRPERIAAALNLKVQDVKESMTLLDGIHVEASDLLKDKGITKKALRFLRKVTSVRQIEISELMVMANNYTSAYAEALVLGTPEAHLLHPKESKKRQGLSRADIAKMEEEMETLERDFKAVNQSYGENNLNLTLARGYIKKLLANVRVVKFLNGSYPDILAEFESITPVEAL